MPDPAIELCERGLLPDRLMRAGVRRLIDKHLQAETATDRKSHDESMRELLAHANSGPIAHPLAELHARQTELPGAFFEQVLGTHMKSSCCLFESATATLDEAEHAMLALMAERARIRDGQRILDLDCGWGSFSLWAARRFPHASIHAVSNSSKRSEWIRARAHESELGNLVVETCDINNFTPEKSGYDRIVSVETLELLRNYRKLLKRCSRWLDSHGRLFVHIYAHRHLAYRFDKSADNWLARHAFIDGIMPSECLLAFFQQDLTLQERWWLDGHHYGKTANAWLERMDAARKDIMPMMASTYGKRMARIWFNRWRIYLIVMAEMFGHRHGSEWGVCHYLFVPHKTGQ